MEGGAGGDPAAGPGAAAAGPGAAAAAPGAVCPDPLLFECSKLESLDHTVVEGEAATRNAVRDVLQQLHGAAPLGEERERWFFEHDRGALSVRPSEHRANTRQPIRGLSAHASRGCIALCRVLH